jgi:hypothetical protein
MSDRSAQALAKIAMHRLEHFSCKEIVVAVTEPLSWRAI